MAMSGGGGQLPGQLLVRPVAAEPPGRDAVPQMPGQFRMHGLDGLQGGADPHDYRFPGPLGAVAGDSRPTA